MNIWQASIFTLYPSFFPGPLGESLSGAALAAHRWALDVHDIRAHGLGRHKNVDDTPAGGGPGMVLRADVLAAGIDAAIAPDDVRPRLLMSPRGQPLTQSMVRQLSQGPGVIIVCGRFEGVDERVIHARGLQEVSIGDYVLSGGELPAMVMIDACVRLLPDVMGHAHSGVEESFEQNLLEYPHYTRPRMFEDMPIPDILLSGDHAKIAAWRRQMAFGLTQARRPDLLQSEKDGDKDV